MDPIEQLRIRVRTTYAAAIGRHRRELTTPALILDLDIARRNIATMAQRMRELGTSLRPHTKVQKCAELARLQIDAGAVGVCCGTIWEAIVLRRSGISNVLMANITSGGDKMAAIAREAKRGVGLILAVDDPKTATDLAAACAAAGSTLDVLIDLDVGMGRAGVRSIGGAVALARHLASLPSLRLRGLQGYEGHCMLEPDPGRRRAQASQAIEYLEQAVAAVEQAGFPCEIVSAGGTGTYNLTGARARVTEVQAGSYVLMDRMHGDLVPGFEPALTVLGTIASRHGRTVVFDTGRKSIGIDFSAPTLAAYPNYQARFFAEEHALFEVDDAWPLELGDTAEFIPGYAPTTVNLHDAYHVVEEDHVIDIWPIIPRGPGHLGLLNT